MSWKALAPIVVTLALALLPAPQGLAPHAWYFFAIFAGVIVALMLEPLPGGAVGLIGVTVVTVLSPYVLFAPAELAKPGFKAANAAIGWALSGFSNVTVWLIFGAFMFALGYDKTGLGRRISLLLVKKMGRRTLTLGYAVAIADTIARAVHAVQHGAFRRHDLPGDPQSPRALRQQAQRSVGATDRLLPDVGGDRDHLRHELDVPDRPRAQSARARARREDRRR